MRKDSNQILQIERKQVQKKIAQETNVSIKLTDLQACRSRSKVKKNRANSSATLPLYKRGKKWEGRPPTSTAQWATNAWRQEQQIYGRLIARCRWNSRLSALLHQGEVFHCRKLVSLVIPRVDQQLDLDDRIGTNRGQVVLLNVI